MFSFIVSFLTNLFKPSFIQINDYTDDWDKTDDYTLWYNILNDHKQLIKDIKAVEIKLDDIKIKLDEIKLHDTEIKLDDIQIKLDIISKLYL
jgi:hypothetical protein